MPTPARETEFQPFLLKVKGAWAWLYQERKVCGDASALWHNMLATFPLLFGGWALSCSELSEGVLTSFGRSNEAKKKQHQLPIHKCSGHHDKSSLKSLSEGSNDTHSTIFANLNRAPTLRIPCPNGSGHVKRISGTIIANFAEPLFWFVEGSRLLRPHTTIYTNYAVRSWDCEESSPPTNTVRNAIFLLGKIALTGPIAPGVHMEKAYRATWRKDIFCGKRRGTPTIAPTIDNQQ